MYTALYRAQRPEVFDEILGQEHIVKILKNQIATGSVNHAYLFCGTRGTGKTTLARILAKAVNCLDDGPRPCGRCANCMAIKEGNFIDVIEIDAASNNGVDNIRELRESVKYSPAVGRRKVYIIDEAHMLSSGAFNALLKTLEEPPEYVMFILATTEPQKMPATILSRCMRLDFKRVPQNILAEGMRKICRSKGVTISEGALKLLASNADGSVRDGLSILDQVLASGEKNIDREQILEFTGAAGEDFFIDLTELVSLRKVAEALILLDGVLADGKDVKQLMKDWSSHYRNLLITKFIKNPEDIINMSTENIDRIREQSRHISLEEINDAIIRLSKTINDARWSTQPRILLEVAIVAIATGMDGSAGAANKPMAERREAAGAANRTVAGNANGGMQRAAAKPHEAELSTATIASASAATSAGTIANTAAAVSVDAAANVATSSGAITNADTNAGTATIANADAAAGSNTLASTAAITDVAARVDALASTDTIASEDNEMLWHEVFEEGEDEAGSFNLIRNGTVLEHVGDNNFTVIAKSSFIKKYVEQRSAKIEQIMSKKLGKPMRLICYIAGDNIPGHGPAEPKKDDIEQMAKRASDILGIDIEIE